MNATMIWVKRTNESAKAYHAFCVYRDLGANRSFAKTWQALGKNAGYRRVLEDWSSKYHWVDRVVAYDAHLEAKLREDLEARILIERRKQIERELVDTARLLGRFDDIFDRTKLHVQTSSKKVDELDDDGKPTGNKIEVKTVDLNLDDWSQLTNWLEDIHRMRRLALNMPQRSTQAQVQVQDWRSDVTELLRSGKVTVDDVRRELGDEIAQELLIALGISSATT
jgi:hypothetical protein